MQIHPPRPAASSFICLFPNLFSPFFWSLPEVDEEHLSLVQGQGQRDWKRKISCIIPLLTGTSFLMVYVCITRCRLSFLPLKKRSKIIASIHSCLTTFRWFWKIWRVYSQPMSLLQQHLCCPGWFGASRTHQDSLPQSQSNL